MQATVRLAHPPTDAEIESIEVENPSYRVERIGDALVMSPGTTGKTGNRNARLTMLLVLWGDLHGYECFDSNSRWKLPATDAQLPDSIIPDTSLARAERWNAVLPDDQDRIIEFVPDIAVELLSKSDVAAKTRAKCERMRRLGIGYVMLLNPYAQDGKTVEEWGQRPAEFPTDWSVILKR